MKIIYNKNLSVCPLTTHIPLKNVSKTISKKRIINHVKKINNFYKKKFNKKPSFAITGLNPHCECNLKSNEEDKIIGAVGITGDTSDIDEQCALAGIESARFRAHA